MQPPQKQALLGPVGRQLVSAPVMAGGTATAPGSVSTGDESGRSPATSVSHFTAKNQSSFKLQVKDHCFYKSTSHGWIPARVLAYRQEDDTYDLDVKPRAVKENIRSVREGDVVEYYSSSTDAWIKARVMRKANTPGLFDLDCKGSVHLGRLRPLDGGAFGAGDPLHCEGALLTPFGPDGQRLSMPAGLRGHRLMRRAL